MPLSKIQTAVITDNAITTAKVNADAITNAKLADDAIQTENVASSVNLGRRNLIFNGAMQVWQRSTDDTESGTGWGFRHADRYYTNKGRYRKETATIDGREWDIMHIDDAGAGYNGGRGMIYKHEYYRDYSNTLTLSFYAKASSSSTVNVGASNFGGSQLISGQNVTLTTSWNRYNFQLTASSAPTQTGETYIINALDNGVDYYITGIQMEVGTTATPFEHRSFGEELSLCQRYYEVVGTTPNTLLFQNEPNTTTGGACRTSVTYIEKRVAPTASINGTWSFGNGNTFVVSAAGLNSTRYDWTSTTTTSESFVYNSNAGATLSFDAEL